MPEAIEHIEAREDAVGGDEVVDESGEGGHAAIIARMPVVPPEA